MQCGTAPIATLGFVVHELLPRVTAQVTRPRPVLPKALDAEVERIWQAACHRMAAGGAGKLFNGSVFSIDTVTPHHITGHLTEFRRAVAQMERPELYAELGVRPLAVCGVLRCAEGVVIGRRHVDAIYQPGMWQLPPAGSVDGHAVAADGSVDLAAQLLTELEEELGVRRECVAAPHPLCIVEHPGSHVSDLGMLLTSELDAAAVLTAHTIAGNREYQPLRVVNESCLAEFIASVGETLVPPAHEFLRRAGIIARA